MRLVRNAVHTAALQRLRGKALLQAVTMRHSRKLCGTQSAPVHCKAGPIALGVFAGEELEAGKGTCKAVRVTMAR